MHLLRRSCRVEGRNGTRGPLLPIRTLLEDKEDGEDYSEVIEFLKQNIKSYNRVIASQSSDIKILLLSLNTLKASIKDSVSAIKNISSTLASLTNSSNAAATGKTSYSPRFDPFSGTMDIDSPPRPPRKEPHLGPAIDNTATSNLDPPIDIGSKEGFKDTITSSIVKELSKKAYTIPDDSKLSRESNFEQWIQALSIVLKALGISNFLENPDISNTYSDSNQAILLMLLRNSLSSSPRAAISRPIESKKEDVYNEFHALIFSTYKKGLLAFNAEFNGYLAKLTMAKIDIDPSLILNQQARMLGLTASSLNIEYLIANILEESRNLAIEAYRAAYIANSSNLTPNSNSNPSKKGKNKKKGKKKASYNIKGQNYSAKSAEQASFILGSYNLAIEEEEESDSSSNSSSSSDSNTQLAQLLALKGYKKRKDFKGKGLKTSSNNKAKYKDNKPRRRPRDPALYNSWLYNTGSTDHISNSKERFTTFTPNTGQLRPINTGNSPISLAGIGSITLEVLSRKAPPTYTKLRNKIVVEIPSNSIRKEDYRPIIEDAIVSEAIEPNKRYKLRNSPAKGTTLEDIGPSLRGKRPYRPTREPKPLTGTRDLPRVLRELVIEGNKVEKAISSPTLKEPNIDLIEGDTVKIRPRPYNRNPIVLLLVDRKSRYRWVFNLPNKSGPIVANAIKGFFRGLRNGFGRYPTKFYFNGGTEITDLLTTWLAKRGIKFSTSAPYIHKQNGLVERLPTDNTALEGELVDLDLDLEGAVSPDPSNLNTEKPISIEIGPSKLEPYESSSDSELDEPSPDKPINPVIVESTRPTISIRKPELPEPITNEPLDNSDLISEGDKMQLDYYKLLAKTSSYILDERSKWLEAITKEFIQLLELGVFKFLPRSLLPSNYWEIEQADFIGAFLNSALREEIYMEIPKGLLDLAASNKAIYKLLLKYSYNPSTPNIIKLSKALYSLKQSPREWQDKLKILLKSLGYLSLISDPGVFYNAKTCHFIVTYIDDFLFIGPNIGYITDLKKRLNKVYAIEDLGPAAYFLGLSRSLNRPTKSHLNAAKNLFKYLNSTKDYSIYFSYNGNTVANLGPKLSNSSNTTTKLSRDFHSKEGPRPLTTTSTTIVDSRNSKGSSRTSIINSSLVPIGFSDSDFAGDKATSKSTYGYLYKLAEAIREVQWIIGLFSELHRPIDYPITLYGDNQGSITVANDPALYARTKHTLLKFRYVREQVKAKIVTIIYLNTKCF
ncbi:hypothetical protein P8C59_006245 [Phyllachora maydis]|uniref:Integrase catalytic domain-containing protein n=1 Tax=Phyllachora maydis TaxID=1825666 RepID=A0AAD9I7B3_9PEZI|nr:hypothetical protein P8C59_006245 [Phyllachora maydis]